MTRSAAECVACGAPLTGLPVVSEGEIVSGRSQVGPGTAAGVSGVTAGFAYVAVTAGLAAFAFCAYAVEQVVHGYLTQGAPAQAGVSNQTPGDLAFNLTVWGLFCVGGMITAIWGFRRLRRSRADRRR